MHINSLRNFLDELEIDAYIIPTADPHNSECIPNYWKIREFITGFTGSAGTAVVTNNYAGLWTDSRYFIQAEKELNKPFVLNEELNKYSYLDWLEKNLPNHSIIGINPQIFSISEVEKIYNKLRNKKISLKLTDDIFNKIWKNRPTLPCHKVFEHDIKYTGLSRSEKINTIRIALRGQNITCWIATGLDDIAWTLNIRGNDIEYNPVVISYLIICESRTIWFVNKNKISAEIQNKLETDNIFIQDYNSINEYIKEIYQTENIATDKNISNYNIFKNISHPDSIKNLENIIGNLKAIKNSVEITNYKNAQIKDANAMVNFLYWFYHNTENSDITEVGLAEKITEFRKKQKLFVCNSFNPISAYGANAALPHYSANKYSNSKILNKGMYLIDSGGQYYDGTTDITRTISTGEVSCEEKNDFTNVLKGHIRIASTRFPIGTKGFQLDSLSRIDLWNSGKNFGHGTGHGIGFFLNVHEGPHGINSRCSESSNQILREGMLVTNEPGIYIKNKYGIRTENVLLCVKDSHFPEFLKFETLTLCPFDKSLININLLTSEEIIWINDYHKKVFETIAPTLHSDIRKWLNNATSPL